MHPLRFPALPWLATAGMALLATGTAHAADTPAVLRLEPGLHVFDQPQVFAPDGVLELVLSGGVGCASPCHSQLLFKNTVHFDGTLKLTMDDQFLAWGGHQMVLFIYWGVPDMAGTGLPTGHFHTLDLPQLDPSQGWGTDSLYTNGSILLAQLVPEPPTPALWLGGAALLAALARARRPAAVRTA
ncbi:MAG TPA: hypothetical protein PK306_23655 [Aquabacterium sp.]|nr:hypothetical protein [Aquabacterium sp.]HQC98702.1 hypothetical protein [Aquabacterium sp.]